MPVHVAQHLLVVFVSPDFQLQDTVSPVPGFAYLTEILDAYRPFRFQLEGGIERLFLCSSAVDQELVDPVGPGTRTFEAVFADFFGHCLQLVQIFQSRIPALCRFQGLDCLKVGLGNKFFSGR